MICVQIMAGSAWRIPFPIVVAAVAFTVSILLHSVAANGVNLNECRVSSYECDPHAYCEDTATAYRCVCRFGWYGDGYTGDNNSGCRKHRLQSWQVVLMVVGSIFGIVVFTCMCCFCVRNYLIKRRLQNGLPEHETGGGFINGYKAQQPYSKDNSKVPSPPPVV